MMMVLPKIFNFCLYKNNSFRSIIHRPFCILDGRSPGHFKYLSTFKKTEPEVSSTFQNSITRATPTSEFTKVSTTQMVMESTFSSASSSSSTTPSSPIAIPNSTSINNPSSTTSSEAHQISSSMIVPVGRGVMSYTSSNNSKNEDVLFNSCWHSIVDTQELITSLVSNDLFTTSQAEALVIVAKEIILEKMKLSIIAKQQVETDAQMLKARCHEIRLELQIHSSKNATARKAIHEKCINEIQSTIEKLRDAVDMLQTDARLRLSIFKGENREELSKIDSSIHQKNSQLTLHMSDIKTFIEGIKVRLMFMFTSFLILAFLILVLEKNIRKKATPEKDGGEGGKKFLDYDHRLV